MHLTFGRAIQIKKVKISLTFGNPSHPRELPDFSKYQLLAKVSMSFLNPPSNLLPEQCITFEGTPYG